MIYILNIYVKQMLPSSYTSIHGWCTIEKANKLMELVKENNPSLIVEFGVFGGKSLLPFALSVKQNNYSCKVIGIDAWEPKASLEGTNSLLNDEWWSTINYKHIHDYAKQLIVENNVESIVELLKNKSKDCVDKFQDNSIDILHQDSNHSEEISCEEVELYWNKVKSGGFWVFDDTNWATTKKAQDLLLSKGYSEIYTSPATTTSSEWKIFCRL